MLAGKDELQKRLLETLQKRKNEPFELIKLIKYTN